MAKLVNWFRQAVASFLDADRENDVRVLVHAIEHGVSAFGQNFDLRAAVGQFTYEEANLREATQRVYRSAVERWWCDGQVTADEQNLSRWLAAKLEITSAQKIQLDYDLARRWFGIALAEAMQDGILDRAEESRLRVIATSAGCALHDFARLYFQREGEAFLRTIFVACVADGHISQSDWDYLIHVSAHLGLSEREMLAAIGAHAQEFVIHVLHQAKGDGVITHQEQETLFWLLQNLKLSGDFCRYVQAEIERVNAPPVSPAAVPRRLDGPACIDIQPKGRFAIDVVGESKYQDALIRLCGGKQRDSADQCFPAVLYLEDNNPYDDRAVRVDIHGDTVGYLERDVARRFRRWLRRHGHVARAVQCQANVRGGWYRGPEDEGHFGVFLDLPLREAI